MTRRPVAASFARMFFFVSVAVYCVAGGVAGGLMHWGPAPPEQKGLAFPPVFGISTLLLVAGSVALDRAWHQVRREKQRAFRQALLAALALGTGFVSLQSYGLWYMLKTQNPAETSVGTNAFVFVLATLHGMHFTIALLFLIFVTVNALTDRYDHEYYWGVTVCVSFWHALGVIWLMILGVFVISL